MFEVAWTAVYVARDPAAADRWRKHKDPKRPAFSAWQACLEGLRCLGHPAPEKQVRLEYETYRKLCWSKHGSPLALTAEFVREQAERLAAVAGAPDWPADEGRLPALAGSGRNLDRS